MIKSAAATVLVALAVVIGQPAIVRPQVRAEYDLGALGLMQSLRRLQTTASAMHTGAHPDDEDSALLARLARGDSARVAYLALNRGEGGQNTIGPELFEPLGIIRTEELLQARRLDGAQQLFTRAFDFGFSRTRDEAAAFWGEDTILDDMVRAIRTFRPLVVISRFSGTPADGHGHHQLAGYLTPIAVARAADPAAFPAQLAEGLRPWRTLKLYVSEGFQPSAAAAAQPTLQIGTGRFDPVLGRSYFEVAMEGRSLHRSQHQGTIELRGARTSGMRLLNSSVDGPSAAAAAATDSVFTGIDTTIAGIPRLAGAPAGLLDAELATVQQAVDRAIAAYRPFEPAASLPALAGGLHALRAAQLRVASLTLDATVKADLDFRLSLKQDDFIDALTRAAGLVVDPLAEREIIAPGGTLNVTVQSFYPAGTPVEISGIRLQAPAGWRIDSVDATAPPATAPAGRGAEIAQRTDRFRVSVMPAAAPTQPYWLTEPRNGALCEWPEDSPKGQPFSPPVVQALITARIGGEEITLNRAVEFRTADPTRGELRRRIDVVPAMSVAVNDPLMIVAAGPRRTEREVIVRAENLVPGTVKGTLTLHLPAGWAAKPAEAPFSLETGDRTSVRFTLTVPPAAAAGRYSLQVAAAVGDRQYTQSLHTIAYPHIQTHRYYTPAVASVQVVPLSVPSVRVGYIMGTGDDVAASIQLMGLPVTLLDSEALTTGDLSRFDTIVAGIRASETRPDFIANHKRLLEWVNSGGALIVQYQAPDYADRGLPPFPAGIKTPTNDARVTDEGAPVRILQPNHPAFTTPNRIVASDWSGWVQERSVNDWTTFDQRYTALLESHDPGQGPQGGGEEVAQVGRGVYVYTAYAWFRQLPAGVPGAYRLFANLLALGQSHRTGTPARPAAATP